MNLFYLPGIADGIQYLDAEESRHAVKVLRMEAGDPITLADGKGTWYYSSIKNADAKKCTFEVLEKKHFPKRDYSIHLAIAPTKNADRIEWLVEKNVEMGIDEISFMQCQTSERKNINIERIEKIAISAMKQSQQAWMPVIHPLKPFREIIQYQADQKFIGYVDATNPHHLKALAQPKRKYLILIGPEGDFSNEELELAQKNGFEKISLGTNRLRTETAGMVACQVLHLINS
ncbi:MAG: 16S rRNA (uracil(1498)-N(3))-methyltransferase [Cyclobacteriaceae bacterium]|jgi:16S rRNA (uracil1498-N3)-methyltransferase|nr:16S rRNA (uracil(1498)-N(3))-methyltransferase [Flammeovirgaceae bacterium]